MLAWEDGFHHHHPHVLFADRLMDPSPHGWAISDSADLALMGHELRIEESMAFEWVFQYKACRLKLPVPARASIVYNAPLAAFVNRNNPLSKMTLPSWTEPLQRT